MSVHTAGTLMPTPDDFQTTHRGVALMVKCIDWGGGAPVIALVERMPNGQWVTTNLLYEFDDIGTPEKVTQAAGGATMWVRNVLVPIINAALAERFKPITDVTPAPAASGSLADIDNQLRAVLSWAPQFDGTLQVVAMR